MPAMTPTGIEKGTMTKIKNRYRVLVCGDRDWDDVEFMYDELDKLADIANPHIIHGAARGADRIAGEWAKSRMVPVRPFPADWDQYGKAAGPIRNQQMLDEGKPDLVMAFHNDIENSKGTRDMVRRARKADIEVKVFSNNPVNVTNAVTPDSKEAKVKHVKAAKQSRSHGCHWPGCTKQVAPALWGCLEHWRRLPKHLRDKIWATYRINQEETLTPSSAYVRAAREAQEWIQANYTSLESIVTRGE